jgi:hypothetical protein
MPCDVVNLYSTRRFLDYQALTLMRHESMPPPTPRTLHSAAGFALWCEAADDVERDKMRGVSTLLDRYGSVPLMDGYEMAFDAPVWDKRGDLVMYNVDPKSAWYLDILPVSDALAGRVREGTQVRTIARTHESAPSPAPATRAVFGSKSEV